MLELDHPSCYNYSGPLVARGEWEPLPDVQISIEADGPDWDFRICQVDLYDKDNQIATVYADPDVNPLFTNATSGMDWLTGEDLSSFRKFWILAIAYAWAKRDATKWAEANARPVEPI